MTYGYVRVSSDKQTVENQKFEINNFARQNNIQIDKWVEETISGAKDIDKRVVGELLENIQKDDIIICSEISRLGRSVFIVMEILNICMEKECQVWTIKDNYRLGDNVQSKVLAFAFGLAAEIERQLLVSRTIEGLARRKAAGQKLGRPKGSKNKKVKLSGKEEAIKILLQEGNSKSSIAKLLNVSRSTLCRYAKDNGLDFVSK